MRLLIISLLFLGYGNLARADEACTQPYFSADEYRDLVEEDQIQELERLRIGLQQGCSLALKGLTYLHVSIPQDETDMLEWYRLLVEVSEVLTRQTEVQKDLIDQFLTRIETLNNDLANETKARLTLEEINLVLKSERDVAIAERDKLLVSLEGLKAELNNRSLRLNALSTREARLRQERDILARKYEDALKRIADMDEAKVDLHRQVVAQNEKLKASEDEVAKRDETIARLEMDKADLQAQIDQRDVVIADKDKEIAELETTIVGQAGANAKLNEEIDKLRGMVERRDKKIDDLEAVIADRDATIEDNEKEIAELNDRINGLDDKIKRLQGLLEDADAKIQKLEIEKAGLEKDVADLKDKLAASKTETASLTAALQLQTDRNTALETSYMDSINLLEDLKSQHNELLSQHDEIHADILALQNYRRNFFALMAEVLSGIEGVFVSEDRIILQTEVFFRSGSADVSETGATHLALISAKVKALENVIPADLQWFLQINGHTDVEPIRKGSKFRDNWHLSTERALSVLAVLLGHEVAPDHLAAAGYGEFQPVNPGVQPEDLAQNRRIELRITN